MNAVWIDEGSAMNAAKLRQHGIDRPYFSNRFGNATKDILNSAAAQGFKPGIYTVMGNYGGSWYPDLSPEASAEFLSQELTRIGWRGNAPVCVDSETHDVAWLLAFFKRWRELRKTRPTFWTMESFQAGLFTGPQVAEMVSRNLTFVPQMYRGDMTPVEHSPIIDMLIQGFPGNRLAAFYDSRVLPYRWHGFAYQQNQLP